VREDRSAVAFYIFFPSPWHAGTHTGSSSAGTGMESGLLGTGAGSSAEGGESRSPQRQASLEQRLSEVSPCNYMIVNFTTFLEHCYCFFGSPACLNNMGQWFWVFPGYSLVLPGINFLWWCKRQRVFVFFINGFFRYTTLPLFNDLHPMRILFVTIYPDCFPRWLRCTVRLWSWTRDSIKISPPKTRVSSKWQLAYAKPA
jgi:hypothetical protein